jgi:predicted GIY-YIG superfamily endonuclease
MNKLYYIYEMREVLSPIGKPYIGCTEDPFKRARDHKYNHNLETIPELLFVAMFTDKKEARAYENDQREANGWEREGAIAGKKASITNVRSGQFREFVVAGGMVGGKIVGNMNWINDGTINKRIQPELLKQYLADGWKAGMKPKN